MLLRVKNLTKEFIIKSGKIGGKHSVLKAVDSISIEVGENSVLGLVGESGCGKSTLVKSIARLCGETSGEIYFEENRIDTLPQNKLSDYRRNVQMIFQDPFASLNPKLRIGAIIREPLDVYKIGTKEERKKRVMELLDIVGLPQSSIDRFPHEFSGGQCQRIGIARALALNPKLIIADEPVSALDVSVQAQIINLLEKIIKEFAISFLFISHDFGVVRHISDKIAVMYLGKIVEIGDAEDLIGSPMHPYSKSLIEAIPKITRHREPIKVLSGDLPSPINLTNGCRFQARCPIAEEKCKTAEPELKNYNKNRSVACFLAVKD